MIKRYIIKLVYVFGIFFIFQNSFAAIKVLSNGNPTYNGKDAGINLDSPTRSKIDLAGKWQYLIEKPWYTFKESDWQDIAIPSSVDYEGVITFRRTFEVSEGILSKSAFKFVALGINYECEVYINETFIGKHVGGYTSFEFEIPEDLILPGKDNFIRIVVNNQLNAYNTIPVRKQIGGWKNYCGILRDVYLLATPRLSVDNLHISTSINQNYTEATIKINSEIVNRGFSDSLILKNKATSYILSAEIFERFSDQQVSQSISSNFIVESNKNTNVEIIASIKNPKLWSPETPELYLLKLYITSIDGKQKSVIDQFNINFGVTSVAISENSILLNGKNIVLKGIVWHEDSPIYGASLTYEQMEKDIALIKTLGANAVRFAFHTPHPYMLNLCSRYGLIALQGNSVWNVPANILNDEIFIQQAENQTKEMLERDHVFPCVLAWSIGDKFDSADKTTENYIKTISEIIKKYDSRPVYYGTQMLNNDVCKHLVDFVGIYPQTTDIKNFRQILKNWKKQITNTPPIILGYSKEVEHFNRMGYSDPLSQQAQARFFHQYYNAIKDAKYTASFVDGLTDWQCDRPNLAYGIKDYFVNHVGLLSQDREKRISYEVVRALYNEEKLNALTAGTYKNTFPWAHVIIGLLIIILIAYQSTSRRFAESFKRSLTRSYHFFVDMRDLHAVSVFHTIVISFAIAVTLALLTSNVLYHYRLDKFADYILTYIITNDYIKVKLIEATWNPVWGIAVLTTFFIFLEFLLSFFIKIFSIIIRTKVSMFHVFSVSAWSAAPIIFLSPLAMSLFKIMETSGYAVPLLILIMLFLLWTFFRVLKGISVIYNLASIKIYLGGIIFIFFVLIGTYYYYDSTYAIKSYINLIINLTKNIG